MADPRPRVAGIEERLGGGQLGTPVPTGLRIAGEGEVVSEPFGLREGLLIARIEATGDGDLAATLFDRAEGRLAFTNRAGCA